ncbi:MAG: hypothetical protein ABI585_05060 [Betaproteobacteria bacterium]
MPPPDSRHDRAGTRDQRPVAAGTWSGAGRAERSKRSAHDHADTRLDESFLAHFLRAPAIVGGIVPSSRVLARALSRHAAGFDAIVELGAGAGSVTRCLEADHPRATLTVIERSGSMARRLARNWPRASVRAGCVHERAECLLAQPPRTVAVSSLPFRSLPEDLAEATIAVLRRFLLAHPERRLVQYSYGLREPFALGDPALRWRRAERVWRNLPPAVVWVVVSAQARA